MATTVTKIIDPDSGSGYDYDSLYDWEAAQQGDLTGARDEIAVAKCRCTGGTADTTAVTINGWTTSATQYIKIWTDPSESYRHNGTYQTGNKYRLEVTLTQTNSWAFGACEPYTKTIGLQIKLTANNISGAFAYFLSNYYYTSEGQTSHTIDSCVAKGVLSGTTNNSRGILLEWDITSLFYVTNNFIIDFINGGATNCVGIRQSANYNTHTSYLYNNTIVNCYAGISNGNGNAKANNNLIYSCTVAGVGTFIAGSGYNATNLSSLGYTVTDGATGDRVSQTFSFVSSTDFHLQSNDTGALGFGTNLYNDADYPFQTDIDGDDRGGSGHFWSIGADGGYEERTFVIDPDMGTGYDYDSLYDWEAAVQKTTVCPEVAKCRCTGGTADTTAVTIDGWTTSATQYIKIWTDPSESYRHSGLYETGNHYRIECAPSVDVIHNLEQYVRFEGLQIYNTSLSGSYSYGFWLDTTLDANSDVKFIGNVIRRVSSFNNTGAGIDCGGYHTIIRNNIIYDFTTHEYSYGVYCKTSNHYVFNNTIISCSVGINNQTANTAWAKNNILYNCVTPIESTAAFSSGSGYNASEDTLSYTVTGGSTGDRSGQTFSFINSGSNNFHLAPNDTGALGYGINLYNDADYPFQTDIDGQDRGGSGAQWDIGADQYNPIALYYRTAATPYALDIASWTLYTVPFTSLGYIQLKAQA